MVVGAFPIAKLSVLLVKQISKPIANVCKERAKNSPFFRTYVCMPPAQFYNWCEVKAKMWILNLGKPVNIPVLSQEMAIDLGANLLGESVIFIIGAGLLIVEYGRQTKKETAKEQKRAEEMEHLTSTITDLYFTVQKQQTQLKEMERFVLGISGIKTSEPSIKPPSFPKEPENKPKPPPINIQKIENIQEYSTKTPYPDRGIILKSLNYIQMDVMSSSLFSADQTIEENVVNEKQLNNSPRNSAYLTEVLQNIENNFRSLF